MGLRKNAAGQKIRVFAFVRETNAPLPGDAANITCKVSKDWGAATGLADANPTEVEDGFYVFDLAQEETNANWLDFYPESSTSGVQVIAVPGSMGTQPASDLSTLTADQVNAEVVDALQTDTPVDGKSIVAALQIIGASTAGEVSGAGTASEVFLGLDGATTRITVVADSSGNRTSVTYA